MPKECWNMLEAPIDPIGCCENVFALKCQQLPQSEALEASPSSSQLCAAESLGSLAIARARQKAGCFY